MGIVCSESVSAKRKRVIRGLSQGQECASQLKFLLQKPFGSDGSLSAEELVTQILRSFTETLSVLTSSVETSGEVIIQNLPISCENGSTTMVDDQGSEDSSESRKRSTSAPATKERRGCYKRWKTVKPWITVSHTTDDDHAWRKYGQKEILNSKYPRSYFRCTRKYDQGCQAIKQVQRMQENPEMYQTTYIGFHTCKDILKVPQMVADSGNWESILVNQNHSDLSKVPNHDQHVQPVTSSSPTPTIKQEYPKEDTPNDLTADKLDYSSDIWSDLKDFELSHPAIMPSKMASDTADTVYSYSSSMDFGVDSVHFGTGFHFDDNQLL